MFRNILIATDGSELAERGVAHGLALAKALGARVTVVTATDMLRTGPYAPIPWPSDIARYEALAARSAERILAKAAAAAAAAGLEHECVHIIDELPAEGILKACKEHCCDLIVMSSHGRRGFNRILLGSQTAKVLALSKAPVLVCR
jgi:nucleotide-binding universal stress UspA family protein